MKATESNLYAITFQTKRGGSGVMTTTDFNEVKKKAISQFKQKLTATIYKNGEKIGDVFQDLTQRVGWNWIIKND